MTTVFHRIRNETFDQIDGHLIEKVESWIQARVFTQVSNQIEVSSPVRWRVIWHIQEELT